jgi:hypothetical protein
MRGRTRRREVDIHWQLSWRRKTMLFLCTREELEIVSCETETRGTVAKKMATVFPVFGSHTQSLALHQRNSPLRETIISPSRW